MITVRTSTVESYRLYADPDNDFISAEEMESRIRRGQDDDDSDSTERQELGRAWHGAIAADYDGPIKFDTESLIEARAGLDGAISEVEGSIVLDVGGVPVRVTGHADWLLGLDMLEHKSSLKPIAPDKHAESMQWRLYCLIFGVERVTYRQAQLAVVETRSFIDTNTDEIHDENTYRAKSIDDVVMYPYPGLRADVVRCLHSLLAFATLRGCLDAMDIGEDAHAHLAAANRKPEFDRSLDVP